MWCYSPILTAVLTCFAAFLDKLRKLKFLSRPVQNYHKLKKEKENNGIAIKAAGFNGLGTGINHVWLEQIAKHTLAWALAPATYNVFLLCTPWLMLPNLLQGLSDTALEVRPSPATLLKTITTTPKFSVPLCCFFFLKRIYLLVYFLLFLSSVA